MGSEHRVWSRCLHLGHHSAFTCVHAQSCSTLCDPMDYSPPPSSVHGISRQEYWSESPFPPTGDLPDPGIKPTSPESPALQEDSLPLSHQGSPLTICHVGKLLNLCASISSSLVLRMITIKF